MMMTASPNNVFILYLCLTALLLLRWLLVNGSIKTAHENLKVHNGAQPMQSGYKVEGVGWVMHTKYF